MIAVHHRLEWHNLIQYVWVSSQVLYKLEKVCKGLVYAPSSGNPFNRHVEEDLLYVA